MIWDLIAEIFLPTCSEALREKCPNAEFFLVRIQYECGKIRARKNPVLLDTFQAVEDIPKLLQNVLNEVPFVTLR